MTKRINPDQVATIAKAHDTFIQDCIRVAKRVLALQGETLEWDGDAPVVESIDNNIIDLTFRPRWDQNATHMVLHADWLPLSDDELTDAIATWLQHDKKFYALRAKANATTLPASQTALIRKALEFYMDCANRLNSVPDQDAASELFDMMTLSALLQYPVAVEVPADVQKHFAGLHGVDFPKYA